MTEIVLLGLLGAAFHYLSYRALITRFLWSRYPAPLDKLFSCAACSGFWVGVGIAAIWHAHGMGALGLGANDPLLYPACGLVALTVTPIMANAMILCLQNLSTGNDGEASQ